MRLVALLVLAGCPAAQEDYPVGHGGYGPGSSSGGMRDSGTGDDDGGDGGDGGTTIAGRLCLVTDLRALTTCEPTGAGGVTITLGSQTATTADDGRFTITAPQGSGVTWHASGGPIVPSVMPFSAQTTIPAVTADTYNTFLQSNGVLLAQGQGSMFARIVRDAQPVTGTTVTTNPPAAEPTFYDGDDSAVWDQDVNGTGAAGVAWLTGVPIGTAMLTVTPPGGPIRLESHRVEDLAITFPTIEIP